MVAVLKHLLLFIASTLVVGCAWQDVEQTVTEQAKGLRLAHGHTQNRSFRWALSPNAQVTLAQNQQEHAIQRVWNQAALAGVNKVFVARSNAAPNYQLLLDWPSMESAESTQTKSGSIALLGINVIPEFAKQGRVGVRLIDSSGLLMHQSELRIAEPFWGSAWHQEEVIEEAFQAFATSLIGG